MTEKVKFARRVMEQCTQLILAHVEGYDAREVFNDREYYPAGSNEMTDEDVAELEIKASEVTDVIVFFENLQKMLDGLQIIPADYRKSLNMMRIDK